MPRLMIQNPTQQDFTSLLEAVGSKSDGKQLRYDGETLHTHNAKKLSGAGKKAMQLRTQKHERAAELVKNSLAREYGDTFALRVLSHARKAYGVNLNRAVTRKDMHSIQKAVDDLHRGGSASWTSNAIIESFQQGGYDALQKDALSEQLVKGLIGRRTSGLKNELGDRAKADGIQDFDFEKFLDIAQLRDVNGVLMLTVDGAAQLEALSGQSSVDDLSVGLSDANQLVNHLVNGNLDTASEDLRLKLALAKPSDLRAILDHPSIAKPKVAYQTLCTTLHLAVDGDNDRFVSSPTVLGSLAPKLAEQLDPETAYEIAVDALANMDSGGLSIDQVRASVVNVVQRNNNETQVVPLGNLTKQDIADLAELLNNPDGEKRKQLLADAFDSDPELLMKVATTPTKELKAHFTLADLEGLSADDACESTLQVLSSVLGTATGEGEALKLTIDGVNYQFEKNIGKGAFGDVKLFVGDNGSRIVLKETNPHYGGNWDAMAREAKMHYWLASGTGTGREHIADFHGVVRSGDRLFMTMKFYEGGDISAFTEDNAIGKSLNDKPKLAQAVKLSMLQDMLMGLQFLQESDRQGVHHDLKEANIFMDGAGKIVLADFGTVSAGTESKNYLAVDAVDPQSPETKALPGIPHSNRSDTFAMGRLALHLLQGFDMHSQFGFAFQMGELLKGIYNVPHGTASEKQLKLIDKAGLEVRNGQVVFPSSGDDELDDLIHSMLAADPEDRPSPTELLSHPVFSRPPLDQDDAKSDLRQLALLSKKLVKDPDNEELKSQIAKLGASWPVDD